MLLKEVEKDSDKELLKQLNRGWICDRCNASVGPQNDVCPECNKDLKETIKDTRQVLNG
jgi:rubrerythrin